MKNKVILFALAGLIFWSCEKTDVDTVDMTYDYYPLSSGSFTVFNVVEYSHNDFTNTVDTNTYLLKEMFDSTFIDGEGRTAYLLKRYKSPVLDSAEWILSDVWTVYKGNESVERTEENVVFVKLTFPLRRSKTWDGNARNDSSSQTYTVLDYDLKSTIGDKSFAKTCRINQFEKRNLIEDELAEEIYARDFGLVFKVNRKLQYNPADSSIVSGFNHIWTYKESGIE